MYLAPEPESMDALAMLRQFKLTEGRTAQQQRQQPQAQHVLEPRIEPGPESESMDALAKLRQFKLAEGRTTGQQSPQPHTEERRRMEQQQMQPRQGQQPQIQQQRRHQQQGHQLHMEQHQDQQRRQVQQHPRAIGSGIASPQQPIGPPQPSGAGATGWSGGGWSGGAAALVPQASAQPPPTQPHEPAGRKDALEMLREWKRQEALAAQNQ